MQESTLDVRMCQILTYEVDLRSVRDRMRRFRCLFSHFRNVIILTVPQSSPSLIAVAEKNVNVYFVAIMCCYDSVNIHDNQL